jgi:riboflavin kinase/FMN adenylyltransferase
LVNTFHPHTIVIGHDHRFGKGRSGDFKLLEEKAKQFNFIITEIDPYILQKTTISSTSIRKMLLESNVEDANTFLGYDYFFSGMVVPGNKMGRTIGYPTANIILQDKNKLVPGNGVYAVKVMHNNFLFSGMMNIGVRPTVAGINRVTEVNIFDFDKEIYGDELTVTIKNKLRNEIKFDSLNELKNQLERDKQAALQFLNRVKERMRPN